MNLSCAYRSCELPCLTTLDARIEIKAVLPDGWSEIENVMQVSWKHSGEAVFHTSCWSSVLKLARRNDKSRAKRKNKRSDLTPGPSMNQAEKLMVVQAAKTLERFDSAEDMKKAALKAAEYIRNSEHCIAFTGAGISTSAGLGDFRGKSGKWTEEDRAAMDGCIQEAFDQDVSSIDTSVPRGHSSDVDKKQGVQLEQPDRGNSFMKKDAPGKRPLSAEYKIKEQSVGSKDDASSSSSKEPLQKRPKLEEEGLSSTDDDDQEEEENVDYENLRPTYTHEALTLLMERSLLHYVVSQNCDGLHLLSGLSPDHISELHGNVFVEKCPRCQKRYSRNYYVLHDEASRYYEELEDFGKSEVKKPKFAVKCPLCGLCHRTGRRCEEKTCSGFLEDTIINFRDNLEEAVLDRAMEQASVSDLVLCLGTTLTVTPACDIVEEAKGKLPLIICNRQKTEKDDLAKVRVFGDCDVFMAQVLQHLLPADGKAQWEGKRQDRMLEYNKKREIK